MKIGSRIAAIALLVWVGSVGAQEPEGLGPIWQYDTGG